jgi:DNA-binding transcriptional LysR family regulator
MGKVDATFCRLPLSHDGLVQCAVLFEDKRKLVVPAGDRLVGRSLIDPEELALETLPTHTLWTADCQRACRRNCPGMSCGGGIGRGSGHLWRAG